MKALVLLNLFAFIYTTNASASADGQGIVGMPAPELGTVKWHKDKKFSVLKNRGKVVFINFFQSWCPGCHKEGLPALKKISKHFKGNPKVKFVAVQTVFEGFKTNTEDKIKDIKKKYDLDMPMGHEAGRPGRHPLVMWAYNAGGTPWSILVDHKGKVVANGFSLHVDKTIPLIEKMLKDIPEK